MTGRTYRSSHEPLSSTPAKSTTKRRKAKHVAAAPVALAAIATLLFGSSSAQANTSTEAPDLENVPQIPWLKLAPIDALKAGRKAEVRRIAQALL